jgi:hypothetical protein
MLPQIYIYIYIYILFFLFYSTILNKLLVLNNLLVARVAWATAVHMVQLIKQFDSLFFFFFEVGEGKRKITQK